MMNSCDVLLVDRIDEKFDELDLYEQEWLTSRLHLMKCSPSVTLLLQPSRESLRLLSKMALPRSQMRMSMLIRSRSLPSQKTGQSICAPKWTYPSYSSRVHSVLCYRFQADFCTSAGSWVIATASLFD
jgi:hypothetical protein